MVSISVQNETAYTVTDIIAQHIRRDAQEHFGEAVRTIRVQEGLPRHAFNVRTGEVRYAFSPQDFGLLVTPPSVLGTRNGLADILSMDDDPEAGLHSNDLDGDEDMAPPMARPFKGRARRRRLL